MLPKFWWAVYSPSDCPHVKLDFIAVTKQQSIFHLVQCFCSWNPLCPSSSLGRSLRCVRGISSTRRGSQRESKPFLGCFEDWIPGGDPAVASDCLLNPRERRMLHQNCVHPCARQEETICSLQFVATELVFYRVPEVWCESLDWISLDPVIQPEQG